MLKRLTAVTAGTILSSYLYSKVVEKRSYPSFLFEMMLRVTRVKQTFVTAENAQRMMDKVSPSTKGPFKGTSYHFKHKVEVYDVQGQTVYIINNQNDRQQSAVLYIHGGAWFRDPRDQHFSFVDDLAATLDAKIVMPIYKKVPHADYRTTFDLLETLYKRLLSQVESAHQLTIMGDSAGGQMALSFAQYLKTLQLPQPSNIVMISPLLDATLSNPEAKRYEYDDPMIAIPGGKFFLNLWAGDRPLEDWRLSPINGDLTHLGHVTIIIGTKETLYPDAERLSHKLNEQMIPHDFIIGYNLFHVFPIFPIPERKRILNQLKQIIHKH
ncbi:alpha/beta hydrolase fold domain-containing protein [Staphylococcus auricularis]|uniref:Alpha/beta hydrolase n=1 Tax=Staphylococcus auricularis TaxID=29379 RepID=A0ABX5IG44_9STAP|nr:alpha/beta hydrolase [Staphylococcus auricularis]MCE5038826.1 alpha/beta hydrolase [Staphylococcus auricularis]MEB6570628.1 alpha/beta hydrolase [Staphylococcus auricularis]PTH18883.1 alpha/beta hydrolase [Staphylococcus auricularis]PTH27079.1 alpha/beta hydrolase [Staphylococcus auricularis]